MATAKNAVAKLPAPKKSKAGELPATPQAGTASDGKHKAKAKPEAAGDKAEKARKPKLVRDSFTMPKDEYAVLDQLKSRAAKLGRPTKKSEVLRAGVQALAAMGDAAFLATVTAVPAIKTGRPAKV